MKNTGLAMQVLGPVVSVITITIAVYAGNAGKELMAWCFMASVIGQFVSLVGTAVYHLTNNYNQTTRKS